MEIREDMNTVQKSLEISLLGLGIASVLAAIIALSSVPARAETPILFCICNIYPDKQADGYEYQQWQIESEDKEAYCKNLSIGEIGIYGCMIDRGLVDADLIEPLEGDE